MSTVPNICDGQRAYLGELLISDASFIGSNAVSSLELGSELQVVLVFTSPVTTGAPNCSELYVFKFRV